MLTIIKVLSIIVTILMCSLLIPDTLHYLRHKNYVYTILGVFLTCVMLVYGIGILLLVQ